MVINYVSWYNTTSFPTQLLLFLYDNEPKKSFSIQSWRHFTDKIVKFICVNTTDKDISLM